MEMLTHGLCSTAENFTHLRRPIGPAVSLSNPANMEYEVVRTTLLPGALKTLAHNKKISHKGDGVRLFEVSDVVLPCDNEVGARNLRKMVALHAAHSSAFEVVHGLCDRVMRCVQIVPQEAYAKASYNQVEFAELARVARPDMSYYFKPSTDPLYFPGMGADLVLNRDGKDTVIGGLGVVHPDVLAKFDISYPCSVVELDVEALL
jgi:phenylalanyl-tRNA synthetase beta chain